MGKRQKEVAPYISFVLPPEKAGANQTLIVTQSINSPLALGSKRSGARLA
jgi:hypothetical protein